MNEIKTTKNNELISATLKSKLLVIYSPKNCLKHVSKLRTLEMAINADAPTLGTFKREQGIEFTEGLIMAWLMHLNNILNLNKPMSDEQIEMCAIDIVNEFYALKMSDLSFLFKRIYSGVYGEFYESISIPKVLSFFREYFNERCDFAEQQSIRNHNNVKSDDTFNYSKNVRRIITGLSNQSKK
jgi:hypothetical protein